MNRRSPKSRAKPMVVAATLDASAAWLAGLLALAAAAALLSMR